MHFSCSLLTLSEGITCIKKSLTFAFYFLSLCEKKLELNVFNYLSDVETFALLGGYLIFSSSSASEFS